MTPREITRERLASWKKKLGENNATPLCLIGIGQGHNKGQTVCFIPENGVSEAQIAQLLRGVANRIDRSGNQRVP